MRKWIAFCLIMTMLLGALSGCGNAPATDTSAPTETTAPAPTPIGTLYASFGAALELTYDENGNALSITGTNEAGKLLAEAKQDQLNKGCVYALRSILRKAINDGLLGADTKTVTIRIGVNDPLPTEDFLNTVCQDCQYLVDEEISGVDLYGLQGDLLDEDGNLTYAMAQRLATKHLGADATGDETITDGVYTFTAADKTCTVNALTGLVTGK